MPVFNAVQNNSPKLVFLNWESENISIKFLKKFKCDISRISITELLGMKKLDDVNIFLFHDCPSSIYDFYRLREIKQFYPSIPIVITSENRNGTRILNAFRMRVWDYIVLPMEKSYLIEKIKYCLNICSKNNESIRDVVFPSHSLVNIQGNDKLLECNKRTQRGLDVITSSFDAPLTIEKLASLCHMSGESFSRNFKKEHGISVRSYLKLCRIAAGKDLLKDTDLSVQQIAHSVGYENVSLFNRLFKEKEDMSPSQYRNQFRFGD